MIENFSNVEAQLASKYVVKRVQSGEEEAFSLKVVGKSMMPTIRHGDHVCVIPYGNKKCEIGDIVCYYNGSYFVLHRIVDIMEKEGTTYYEIKGDNMPIADWKLVTREQILGYYAEKNSPFLAIYYLSSYLVNVVTYISEITEFLYHICPENLIKKGVYKSEKLCFTVIVYRQGTGYALEVFSGESRETFYFDSLEEIKGHLYSVLFHADSFRNLFSECISFHAGGVLVNGKLISVIGRSGQGKSTLLYYLAKQGNEYLSDEKLYIRQDQDRLEVLPFYSPIMLRSDIGSAEKNIEEIIVQKEDYSEKKYTSQVNKVPFAPFELRGVMVVPRWEKEAELKVKKLCTQDAFSTMMENMHKGNTLKGGAVKIILNMISQIDFYEIQYSNIDECLSKLYQLIDTGR